MHALSQAMVWAAWCGLACAPHQAAPAPEAEPVTVVEAEVEAEVPRTPEQVELDAWIAAYNRGEQSKQTSDPSVAYSGTPELPCEPLPEQRPAGFSVLLGRVDYDEGLNGFFGLSDEVCTFEWGMLHLDAPPGHCTVLEAEALDRLYAQLRALEPWTIEDRDTPDTPHSVGITMVIRTPTSRCSITDVHGWSEVREIDEARWRKVSDLVRSAL